MSGREGKALAVALENPELVAGMSATVSPGAVVALIKLGAVLVLVSRTEELAGPAKLIPASKAAGIA